MTMDYHSPLRLKLDRDALIANYHWLKQQSGGAQCGAVVKANGYGLGAAEVMQILSSEGCRDFFVATWAEARAVGHLASGAGDGTGPGLSVFHGVREADMAIALSSPARPVLNSAEQVARWKAAAGGPCDVMIDTGMNRLGLSLNDIGGDLLHGLQINTVMSHLVNAEEDQPLNAIQLQLFTQARQQIAARRYSLANSAGLCQGAEYHFDLTRPGLALYGGIPHPACEGHIRAVATPQAEIIQRRTICGGDVVGRGADYVANHTMEAAIITLGYADGYARILSGMGAAMKEDARLPVIGRVAMDLLIIDVTDRPDLAEGDWVDMEYDLATTALLADLSQYELLARLGQRFDRYWV